MAEDNDKGFLSRWSQRKQARRTEEAAESAASPSDGPSDGPSDAPADAPAQISEEEAARRQQEIDDYVASLPEPESLSYESDFTAFFKEGVPEALKRRVLRVLWRSNPTLANLDGLIDYGDDYTNAATVVPNLKTLYRVGKGMFSDEDLEAEERKRAGLPPLESETPAEEAQAEAPPQGEQDSGAPQELAAPVDKDEQTPAVEEDAPQREEALGSDGTSETAAQRPRTRPVEKKRSALARRWGADPDSAA